MIQSSPESSADVRESRELIPTDSPLAEYISVNPARLHGEPCFRGSRVPIEHLFMHLRAGDPLEEFLAGYPSVAREAAIGVIDLASHGLLEALRRL